MKILPISNYTPLKTTNKKDLKHSRDFNRNKSGFDSNIIVGYYNIAFKSKKTPNFELNFTEEELKDRVSEKKLTPYKMLDSDSKAYINLSKNDKIALSHLVRASEAFNSVYKKIDNPHNLKFEEYLNNEIAKGNTKAEMTKKLYDAQLGIFANDVAGDSISLVKNLEKKPNRGIYPEDLSVEEFHSILLKMLNENKDEEVKNILNQRSIVVRDGDYLKAIDYTEAFKEEFTLAANELEKAAKYTSDNDMRDYLLLQAKAFRENNPMLDCEADKKWATLQDTTLEFTLSRESYEDKMTPTVATNKELKNLLASRGINAYAKDSLGGRVGIVDKAGTKYLLKIKEYLPFMASKMPFNDQYVQSITNDSKQTMVDADIVHVSGDKAKYRGQISLASNLPNNDKLAIKNGGGHRTVYLKQMRNAKYSDGVNEKLNALLNDDFHKYYHINALHDFTILHENLHSLGPKEGLERLGTYKHIIEENKADMGSIVMLEELKNIGFYTEQQQREILTSWIFGYIHPGANFANAHATRNIMQHNYLIKNGAITFDEQNRMKVNFEKVTECAREMLNKIIKIQLSGNPELAKGYIDEHAVFSKELQILANKLNTVSKRLNSYVTQPLAKKLL